MVGNVWEWTHSLLEPYPYKPSDGREDERTSDRRVLRGGSFNTDRRLVRCAVRLDFPFLELFNDIGFRAVASLVSFE